MKYPNNPQAVKNYLTHRRNFLKGSLLLSTGLLLNQRSTARASEAPAASTAPRRSKVSFVTGTDRREMMNQVLSPLKDVIAEGIKGKQIVIKPNFVSTNSPLCATHVDAVRGVLDFLKPMYSGKIIIGESPAGGSAMPGFENYGYMPLQNEYGITFEDFNSLSSKPAWILDRNLYPTEIQLISRLIDPNSYIISLTRLKTHNTVIATMGLKNIVMGVPINSRASGSKRLMHGASPRWLHYNMFLVAQKVRPHLTVIESVEGMEGNGPIGGTPVEHGVALAGTDVMAVDSIGAQLMDVPLENIGYLNYCGNAGLGIIDRENIDIIGNEKPEDHVIKYQLGRNIENQLEWMQPLQIQGGVGPFGSGGGGGGGRMRGGGGSDSGRRGGA